MTRTVPIVMAAALLGAASARGQSVSFQADQTVGYSTDEVAAAATQLRAFGNLSRDTRFYVETAWAARSADRGDAFEIAYPYDNRVQIVEAYVEHLFPPGRGILAVRAGRYRTPFGIYSSSDHAYFGFLRSPIIRYGEYFTISNNFLEQGADLVVGWPRLSLETSVGVPGDVTEEGRRSGLDVVLRGQAALGPLIVGGSYVRNQPSFPSTFAFGHAAFNGIDARWMRGGVQVRGEWVWGQPFDGTSTAGGYLDLIVHRPTMGPVTAVMRAERLDYRAPPPYAFWTYRYTAGTRVRVFSQLAVELDLVHQPASSSEGSPIALDVGLTYSLRRDSRP